MKKLICLCILSALVLCLAPPRADAAGGFTDITGSEVKQAAELLASLNIMTGVGGTRFDPDGTLDRAMLAVIGVKLDGIYDVSSYTATVRFPDVKAGHWAHGWVMASVSNGIMVGMPDGSFKPEGKMQFQYLITVLMRLLGYEDADVGSNWPYSYLGKATSIGLTKGMNYKPATVLTRGQTALILANYVTLPTKDDGPSYMERYGDKLEEQSGVMLLRTMGGRSYYLDPQGVLTPNASNIPNGQDGKAGVFVYNEDGQFLYFTPDTTYTYKTVKISSLYDGYMVLSDQSVVPLTAGTRVITYGADDATYGTAKDTIWRNETVRLAYKDGLLQYIYRDAEEHRSNARYIKTSLRFITSGANVMAADDDGNLYFTRETLSKDDEGKTGYLLIDQSQHAVSFTQDPDFSYQTVTVKEAKAGGLQLTDGTFLPLAANLRVMTYGAENQNYSAAWNSMWQGESFLVAYKNQLAQYIYRGAQEHRSGSQYIRTCLRFASVGTGFMALDDEGNTYPLGDTLTKDNEGKTGLLLIDQFQYAVSFTPDTDYSYQTVTVAEAKSGGITLADGTFLPFAANTHVFTYGADDGTYGTVRGEMWPGESITVAYKNQLAQYIYRDAEEHRSGSHYIETCLRILQTDKGALAMDDQGESYLVRDTLSVGDEGKTGLLLIDKDQFAVSFIPLTTYTYQNHTVKEAKAGGIVLTGGETLTLTGATPVLTQADSRTYGAVYSGLPAGESLMAAYDRFGRVAYIYRKNPQDMGEEAVYRKVDAMLRVVRADGEDVALIGDEVIPFADGYTKADLGKFGTFLINDEDDTVVSFTPQSNYKYKSITLTESVINGLYGKDGVFTIVFASTPVWNADGSTGIRYYDLWINLMPGETLLLAYRPNGTLDYVYRGQSVSGESAAITMTLGKLPEGGANPLTALFGTATATVVKNGCVTDYRTLEPFDVLSYYPAADLVLAVNTRFVATVEGKPSFPSGGEPTLVLRGETYTLTEEAAGKALALSRGTRRLYLLDSDHRIVDIIPPNSGERIPALATTDGVELVGGISLKGAAYVSGLNAQGLLGVYESLPEGIGFRPFAYKPASAEWKVKEGVIGSLSVAPWCVVYERGGDTGAAVQIDLSDLPQTTVPAANIKHVEIGPSGYVTLILLQDFSYESYDFGFIGTGERSFDSEAGSYTQNCVWTTNGERESNPIPYGSQLNDLRAGQIRGLAPGRSQYTGDTFFSTAVTCREYKDLGRYDFTSDGFALIDGKKIPLGCETVYVNGSVVPLDYARVNCKSITVYTDPANAKVRFMTGVE